MKVTILGSGTGIPSAKRGSPGLVVEAGQRILLFDSGPGALRRLVEAGFKLEEVDYVFYSHFHPDHIADLVPLLFALKNPNLQRTKALRLAGPEGFLHLFGLLKNVYGQWMEPSGYELEISELAVGRHSYSEFELVAEQVNHTESSLAYRVEAEGQAVAYSGDSDYCQALVDLGSGVDLLILECAFPDSSPCPGHLTPTRAGELAARAEPKKLLLTHFYPACEGEDLTAACQKVYPGEIVLARDLMTICL